MKKILLSLMALMAILPASAASYFTIASAVNDTLVIKYESVGFYRLDTLYANFDGRLDNWDVRFEFPPNFRLTEVEKCADMLYIPYLDSDSVQQLHDAPLYYRQTLDLDYLYYYIDSLSSTITTPGYWYSESDGLFKSYGTIKWEADSNKKMVKLVFKINSGVQSGTLGTLTINGMLSSTSDLRGGTISETTFTKSYTVVAGYKLGDVNGDGLINVADVTALTDYILIQSGLDPFQLEAADINGDGIVEISDVTALIDLILT